MEALGAIEERINKLEFVFGSGAEDIVRKVQLEFLSDLYSIKEALKEDLKGQAPVASGETEALRNEVKQLKEENTRLHYRIKHLKQNID